MKSNLFCLLCLFVAAFFAILVFSMGGADARSPKYIWADFVFWGIITLGITPALVELICEEYRALRNWIRAVIKSHTHA